MKIFIAIIRHKFGTNFYASKTEPGLAKQLATYTCDWWNQELPNIPLPKSKTEQIDTYFESVDYESLELSEPTKIYG